MKRITVSLLAIVFIVASCTKEGPVGPQGPAGQQGAIGSQGPSGTNASTAFQLTASVPASSWTNYGTSGNPGCGVLTSLTSPYLSFDSVGHGAVLLYNQDATGDLLLLPRTYYSGASYTWSNYWENGNVVIDIFNSAYTQTPPTYTTNWVVVVIPGQKSLPAGINRKDYNSIVAYYHPRTVH